MRVLNLRVQDLRCFRSIELKPGPGLNVFVGENGAGKSSVLEALALLSGGRSFRTSRSSYLIRHGAVSAQVFADIEQDDVCHRLGFSRSKDGWRGRLDGKDVRRLSDLARNCAVLVLEPNALDLLTGPSESRRRLIDWLVFHVEHGYGDVWMRYQRALSQRNALLKRPGVLRSEIAGWDAQLSEAGAVIHSLRAIATNRVAAALIEAGMELAPQLGEASLKYRKGWDGDSLLEALAVTMDRDRQLKFTGSGPHRSDWRMTFKLGGGRHELSRGQQKTACFMLLLALVRVYEAANHQFPIVCVDDLFSELDSDHQARCLRVVADTGAQVWVTGTHMPEQLLTGWSNAPHRFHVEHHQILPVSV